MTPAEIVAALDKQVGNALINIRLQPSVRRTLDLINYNGPKYNLQNSIIDNVETLTKGRITATVKANLLSVRNDSEDTVQINGFKNRILKKFVSFEIPGF